MMLSLGYNHLIALFYKCFTETEGNEIYRCSCTGSKDYLFTIFRIQKLSDRISSLLISLSSLISHPMHCPMDIGI